MYSGGEFLLDRSLRDSVSRLVTSFAPLRLSQLVHLHNPLLELLVLTPLVTMSLGLIIKGLLAVVFGIRQR